MERSDRPEIASAWSLAELSILESELYRRLKGAVTAGARPAAEAPVVTGLPVPASSWVLDLLAEDLGASLLVVVPRESEALAWLEAARLFRPRSSVIYFPSPSLTPYQETEASLLVRAQEAIALDRIERADRRVVVCTPRALFRRLPALEHFSSSVVQLSTGQQLNLEELALQLLSRGFRRTDLVVEIGAFAVRGGIFDLYPPGRDLPVRLDLFGDEVESIREFDPVSQRSEVEIESLRVFPLSLFESSPEAADALAAVLESESYGDSSEAAERIEALARGDTFAGWENYLPMLHQETLHLGQLMSDAMVAVLDHRVLAEEARHHQKLLEVEYQTRIDQGRLAVSPQYLEHEIEVVESVLERAAIRLETVAMEGRDPVSFGAGSTENLVGQLPRFPREIEIARARGDRVVVVSPPAHHQRLLEVLEGRDVTEDQIELVAGELRRGFRLPQAGLAIYGEGQLFTSRPERSTKRRRLAPFLSGLRDLKLGEYVVHEDHGIGQYIGMRSLEPEAKNLQLPPSLQGMRSAGDSTLEVMEITYAQERTLLLPLDRLHQIQRFSGVEGSSPRLDRLGGSSWNRKKSRVRNSLKKLATDLLKLYAERELARAPAAGPDSDSQSQFEGAFEFDETEDQLRASLDIKTDLERTRPMDRLLCGDVGFGKTEVAMRAAFKMVDSGKQVAVLAPTTILADQHHETFTERYRDFPIEVDIVSRFRTPSEVREVAKRVKAGKVDILIGTHRLLSKDIEIPNLGLMIIDEEQRFGVAQKERLKELKRNVHVLAMTATPVPRTLQLSLAGVRDLSTIESPPKDRMAVETRILPFATDLVREAIDFELERGGQIYYVYNRVDDIEGVSEFLKELIPTLRIAVGHGQMDERELGRRMRAFKAGEFDLLLATTIIENGIDIPRVNTMIVHRADRFGLAQLYQLRGRVGRSNQLAFCYLLTPSDRVLPTDARRRLAAIQEFTELGAGFRVAARDLEIRGAGNLLGAEQSGHIAELGIDTYLKMLEDTVRELKGEASEVAPSANIDLPIMMSVPRDYIEDTNLRLEAYRRLASGEESIQEVMEELRDRFGPPPASVVTLASTCELKQLAESLRVQSITQKGHKLTIRLRNDARVDVDLLIQLVSQREHASFSPSGVLTLEGVAAQDSLALARATLESISPKAPGGPVAAEVN